MKLGLFKKKIASAGASTIKMFSLKNCYKIRLNRKRDQMTKETALSFKYLDYQFFFKIFLIIFINYLFETLG